MHQEIVVIKLVHIVRLVEANEQNRIRFKFIFINFRDGVEIKHYMYFQLYIISCINAVWRPSPLAAIQQKEKI